MITKLTKENSYVSFYVKKEHFSTSDKYWLFRSLVDMASSEFKVEKHSIVEIRVTVESCKVDLTKLQVVSYKFGKENK